MLSYEDFKKRGFLLPDGSFMWMGLQDYCKNIAFLPDNFVIEIRYEEDNSVCEWTVKEALKTLRHPFRYTKSWRPALSNFEDQKPELIYSYHHISEANNGDKFFVKEDNEYEECLVIGKHPQRYSIIVEFDNGDLVELQMKDLLTRTEREANWKDEISDYLCCSMTEGVSTYQIDDNEMLDVCRKVLRATGELPKKFGAQNDQ